MPPTRTTDFWSSAIAALIATRKPIACCWRKSFRGRPPSRRLRDSSRLSGLGGRRSNCSCPSPRRAAVSSSLALGEAAKESASETYYGGEEVESAGGMTFTFRIACLNMDSTTIAMCHEYLSCTSLVQADRTLAVRRHRIAPHEGDSTEKSPRNFSGTREHILTCVPMSRGLN